MATFVLVHGAWHGGWCWERIVPLLQGRGHRVLAPDLPGLGADTTPLEKVTLESWARFVADLVSAQPEPVILVGHSRGGVVISRVAELVPGRIASLVYLTAFLLPDGMCLMDALHLVPAQEGRSAQGVLVMSEDQASCTIKHEDVAPVFYNTSEPYWTLRAAAHMRPEPTSSFMTPVAVTEANFGRVPRVYIECLQDIAIPIALQRKMVETLPCRRVTTLDTDHSPFYSAPSELAATLDGIAIEGTA